MIRTAYPTLPQALMQLWGRSGVELLVLGELDLNLKVAIVVLDIETVSNGVACVSHFANLAVVLGLLIVHLNYLHCGLYYAGRQTANTRK